jgi:hypothetical protein
MNNIKCNNCGFANWATAESCRKCYASLAESAPTPNSLKPKTRPPVTQKPSAFQILKNDALSFVAIILPVVMWGVYIAVTFFGVSFESKRSGTVVENSGGSPFFLIAPVVLTVLGAALLSWRITSIGKLFETGERVVGKITGISFVKDRGRIEFSYNYKKQKFQSGSAIMKNSKTQRYRSGDQVILIIDAANPNKVLVQDLYL